VSSHRATRIEETARIQRLKIFIEPVKTQWKNDRLVQALSSYGGFCELMALDKAQDYLAQRRIHEITDWGSVELDAEGRSLQAELEERQTVRTPSATPSGPSNHRHSFCLSDLPNHS
jgi:exportin-5